MALQEGEKILTTLNAASTFAKIKEDVDGKTTMQAVEAKGYIDEAALTAKNYVDETTLAAKKYVDEDALTAKGYITADQIPEASDIPVATSEEILALYNKTE